VDYLLTPLNDHDTGAEIRGLDLTRPMTVAVREALNGNLAKYCVLVFREQRLSPEQFIEAGRIFGDLMLHHRSSAQSANNPSVSHVKNNPVAPGKYLIQGESFHTDHSNDPVPPKASSLFTVSLPSKGGDTQFVNMHNAYDDLPAELKRRIDGLKAVHVYQSKFSPREILGLDESSLKHLPPPAIHPLVRTHPENGRKFLYVNPVKIESIEGMPDDEAQELIAALMAHATQAKYEYRHQWKYGDMVIWDNRSVMHQANGDYDMSEVRHLYKILIKGSLHANEILTRTEASASATATIV
jgi:taurine dioxygenase